MVYGKKYIAAFLAFLLAFLPMVGTAHADALDALAVAVEGAVAVSQEDDKKITDEILENIARDPAQKSTLQEHITKMKPTAKRLEEAQGSILVVSSWLHKIPLFGGILTAVFLECAEWYWSTEFSSDDDPEIVKRYETLRAHRLDAGMDFLGLMADAADSENEESLMKQINAVQFIVRMGSAEAAMKKVNAAVFNEQPENKEKQGAVSTGNPK